NAQTRRSETLANQRSVRSPRATQPRLGLRHILPLFGNGSVRARPLSQNDSRILSSFLSQTVQRTASLDFLQGRMAGDGGNLVRNHFFGALSNALPLPSSSGGAAGMVRCLAGQILAALKMPFSGPSVA